MTLLNGSKEVASDTGEIQITDYGVSGIPVFQMQPIYAALGPYYKEPVSVRINFMPDFSAEQFQAFLENRIQMHPNCSMEHFFIGLFHKNMSAFFLRLANISPAKQAGKAPVTKTERAKLLNTIQHFETVVEATNSYEKAQICAGGLSTDEIDSDTLESRLIDGLYFAGELLDVDGKILWGIRSAMGVAAQRLCCRETCGDIIAKESSVPDRKICFAKAINLQREK